MLQCPFTAIFQGKWNEKFPIIGLEPLPAVSSVSSHTPPRPSSPRLTMPEVHRTSEPVYVPPRPFSGAQVGRASLQLPYKPRAASLTLCEKAGGPQLQADPGAAPCSPPGQRRPARLCLCRPASPVTRWPSRPALEKIHEPRTRSAWSRAVRDSRRAEALC